jgi:leader peptidase (prepilin peptidase)/N-methyltransferase
MLSSDVHLVWVFVVLFGLAFGSFCNVLIYRLPRGQSIISPRSCCPQCKNAIAWFDNIPLLSFIILRGRCRKCSYKIPLRYFAVELSSGALAGFVVWKYGLTLKAIWLYAFLSILLIITFIDWYHRVIPDALSVGGILLGWIGSLRYLDVTLVDSILGSVVGAGTLLVVAVIYKAVRKIDGLGGGDLKLMAMIGAFMGWQMVFPVLFLASLFGSIYGLYLIRGGGDGKTAVAFGSFLAPAAFLVLCSGNSMWQVYLRLYIR